MRKKLQEVTLVVKIHTVATEPLKLGDYTLERLEDALEQAVKSEVDLRYYPEPYQEGYHDFIGITMEEL